MPSGFPHVRKLQSLDSAHDYYIFQGHLRLLKMYPQNHHVWQFEQTEQRQCFRFDQTENLESMSGVVSVISN